ncbi:hypothetical protein [Kribbella soli]|uniref:hypothetical protein n=1 Tax=Kribbella soli TaxID=1124743 RepID=UPI001EDEDEFC|nr:hypothetical protein [Kribbella soli]
MKTLRTFRLRTALAVLAVAAVPAGAVAVPATASAAASHTEATSTATESCLVSLGSRTAGGDHRARHVSATVPPTAGGSELVAHDVYPDGLVRLSTSMIGTDDGYDGLDVSGFVVMGDALYGSGYKAANGEIVNAGLSRVGGGWSSFTAFERAEYRSPTGDFWRMNAYGLRNDGTLFRWTFDRTGAWRSKASYPGFTGVKSMALISKTRTYDTFLANSRSGALYTIHIPTTSPMKPVVKLVRRSTWQGFETMLAQPCGRNGTLLLGIDKDTKAGYLYAVGHANGLATVIQGRGQVPITFDDPVNFRWIPRYDDWLLGE